MTAFCVMCGQSVTGAPSQTTPVESETETPDQESKDEITLCSECSITIEQFILLLPENILQWYAPAVQLKQMDSSSSGEEGDLIYWESRNEYYRIRIAKRDASENGEEGRRKKVAYADPLEPTRNAIPFNEMADEFGKALSEGQVYRVSISPEQILRGAHYYTPGTELHQEFSSAGETANIQQTTQSPTRDVFGSDSS